MWDGKMCINACQLALLSIPIVVFSFFVFPKAVPIVEDWRKRCTAGCDTQAFAVPSRRKWGHLGCLMQSDIDRYTRKTLVIVTQYVTLQFEETLCEERLHLSSFQSAWRWTMGKCSPMLTACITFNLLCGVLVFHVSGLYSNWRWLKEEMQRWLWHSGVRSAVAQKMGSTRLFCWRVFCLRKRPGIYRALNVILTRYLSLRQKFVRLFVEAHVPALCSNCRILKERIQRWLRHSCVCSALARKWGHLGCSSEKFCRNTWPGMCRAVKYCFNFFIYI